MTEYQKGMQRAYGASVARARGKLLDSLLAFVVLGVLFAAGTGHPFAAVGGTMLLAGTWYGLTRLFFGR